MKMNKLIALATLLVGLAMFASCSSDDEPTVKTGEEQVAHLRKCLLDEEGKIRYPESSTSGVHLFPATSETFHKYTELIIDDKWNGKNSTCTLADKKGSIKITKATKEGVYVSLSFAVKGIPSFTLELASEEYCRNENFNLGSIIFKRINYRCEDCGNTGKRTKFMAPFCDKCYSLNITDLD